MLSMIKNDVNVLCDIIPDIVLFWQCACLHSCVLALVDMACTSSTSAWNTFLYDHIVSNITQEVVHDIVPDREQVI
jgi:hypothetical protein